MPGPLDRWYSRYDLEALAGRGAVLGGELRVAELTRLEGALHADRGTAVDVELRFGRAADGRISMHLALRATLSLTCQRCLEPVEHVVDEAVEWVIVESESEAAALDEGLEPVVLGEDRFLPAVLVEDELIVSLPLAPRHVRVDECGALAQNLDGVLLDRGADRAGPAL